MKYKHISLAITILITLIIFSMSLTTGSDSGNLSSGFTLFIKDILDVIFVNNQISMESLHIFVRKSAHVFEYFVLGISYYFTAKAYQLSILKISMIGLITAGVDEWIQYFVPDRAARMLDVFIFDFGGFVLGLSFMLLLFNRRIKMNEEQVLYQIAHNEISYKKGYKYLYQNRNHLNFTNKAHFAKLSIQIPGEEGVNKFLRVLFKIPIPLGILRFALLFVKENFGEDINIKEIKKLINSKGIQVKVDAASGEHIVIKTF
ncbi:VanZ family protein [Mycoplasmatota bacterium]|nr:VanZ family protein [Mycoplasmatota bacterium]